MQRDKQAYSRLRQASQALAFRPAASDPFMEVRHAHRPIYSVAELSVQACRRSFSGSISRSKFSEVSCTDATLDTSLELVLLLDCSECQRAVPDRAGRTATVDGDLTGRMCTGDD